MVLQAVFEDYFQARRGQSGDSAYSTVYRTPKDCQTGDWIAKKEPAFHDLDGEVAVSAGTRSSSPTASTTRPSPVLKEAELISCFFCKY